MSRGDRYREMIGASKSLTVNIRMFRRALGRRGPWKGGSLRDYHDELLIELATAKRSKIRLSALQAR
jgi:hypothetical protein